MNPEKREELINLVIKYGEAERTNGMLMDSEDWRDYATRATDILTDIFRVVREA